MDGPRMDTDAHGSESDLTEAGAGFLEKSIDAP